MWTADNRALQPRQTALSERPDRCGMGAEPLIPPGKPGGGKRRVAIREVINGVMYILSTGCQGARCPRICRPEAPCMITSACGTGTTLDRIHHALYLKCCIIDSQSVKSAEKGGLASTATASMPAS